MVWVVLFAVEVAACLVLIGTVVVGSGGIGSGGVGDGFATRSDVDAWPGFVALGFECSGYQE